MDSLVTNAPETVPHNLEFLFHPQSIAIAGIPTDSSDPRQLRFLKPLIDFGFPGQIYLVNPKGGEIQGFKVYLTMGGDTRLGRLCYCYCPGSERSSIAAGLH